MADQTNPDRVPERLKGATWFGKPIETMDRAELLVAIDYLTRQAEESRKDHLQTLRILTDFAKLKTKSG